METGSPVVFVGTDDQVASEVDFTPSGNTASTTVQAAIEELQGDINGLDGTDDQDLGIGSGGVANESVEVTITDGSSTLVDIRDADSSITNELSQVGAGTPAVTGATASNTGETYVDTTSGQLYVWDGSAWQQVGGSAAPDADPDPTNELSDIAITGTTLELTNAAAGATGVDLNSTFATDTELANAIAASEAADLDKDATNELQNLGEVLADGNDGAGLAITNIADPTNPQDAATKAYVDSISDDDVSVANTVSGNRIATISEPGITDVDINETITTLGDANSDGIFDYQSENGTITSFDGTDDQTAAQVSVTPAGNITSTDVQSALEELDANSSDNQDLNLTGDNLTLSNDPTATPIDLSDYRETVSGTNDITVTDDGNGNYTVDYVDGDKSDTNEITTVTDNLDGTTTILDVNGGTVTVDNDGIDNVDDADNDPLNEIQDASQVSFDDTTAGLGATDTQAAIVALAASNAADNDTDATNEYNTGSGITGGNLELTDGGGTESVNLISTDANNNIAVGSDGALYLNVASVTISETITTLADNGNGSFTYTNEAGSPVTFQASTITNNGDGTSTIALADGGSITVDNDGVDNVDDADNIVGNEYNTGISFDGTDLTITDGGGDQTIDITGVNTDTQDLSIDATGKIISLVDGGSVTINADDADADPNNEIQDLSLSGNTLSLSGDATTVDLSPFVNNDTNELQTLSQSGTDVTLSDGGGTISVADNDNSVTNEVNTAFTVASGNLNITDSNGTLSVPLSSIDTDTQDLSIDATGKIISLVDGGSVTINADDADADATNELQTLSQSGTDVTLSNGGGTISVADNDNSTTNEVNTAFTVASGNLNITDSNGTLSVPLSSIDTDTQDLSIDATGKIISLVDGGSVTINTDDADAVIGNEVVNATDATLTRSGSGTAGDPYTLDVAADGITNAEIADDAVQLENIANGTTTGQVIQWDGTEWTLVDLGSVTVTENDGVIGNEIVNGTDATLVRSGAGTTVSPYTLDIAANGITNAELADNAVGLENLEDGTTVGQVMQWNGTDWILIDASTLDTDTQDLSIDATGKIISLVDGGSVTINADDADASVTNEVNTAFAVSGGNLNITDSNGTLSVPLSSINTDTDDQTLSITGDQLSISEGNTVTIPGADGTETIVQSGNANLTVTGDGSAGSPYTISSVDNVDDADNIVGNEYNTAFGISGSNLRLTDGGGNLDVPLSSLGTDTQDLSIDATGKIISLVDGGSVTINADDADASVTNEVNTAFTVSGGNLNITDNNGTLSVPLSSIDTDTDDQTLSISGDQLSISEGNTITLPTADGTETVVESGNANVTVTGDGSTGNPYQISSVDNVNDADADPSNEIQDLSISGNTLSLSGDATTVDLSPFVNDDTNELQTLSQTGTDVALSNGGGTISVADNDNDSTNELQNASQVSYDNGTSGLSSTDTQGAIDELKADVDAFAATSGQTNTASNVGAGGVGPFARKTGANLEFKNINAGSNKVTVTNDGGNDEIDIDINEANITITESQISDLTHTIDTDDQTLSISGESVEHIGGQHGNDSGCRRYGDDSTVR